MNFDTLLSSQSYGNGLEQKLKAVVKNDNVNSAKKSEFATKNTNAHSSTSAHASTQRDEDFEKFMQDLQKKQAQQNNKQSGTNNNTPVNQCNDLAKFKFHTNIIKTDAAADASDEQKLVSTEDETSSSLDTLAAINSEILKIIATEKNLTVQTDTPVNITTDAGINSDDLKNKISDILGMLANIAEQNKTQGNTQDIEDTNALISDIMDKFKALSEQSGDTFNELNFTPQDLTAFEDILQNILQNGLSEQNRQNLEALAANWVTLTPPDTDQKSKVTNDLLAKPDLSASKTNALAPRTDQAATPAVDDSAHYTQARYDARYDMDSNATTKQSEMSQANNSEKSQHTNNVPTQNDAANTNTKTQNFSQFLSSLGIGETFENTNLSTTSTSPQASLGAVSTSQNSTSSLTNPVTQSQSAGTSHPATQTVAATLQRVAKAGEDTTLKLRLDPPELGRVEVKMSVDKNNMTKIVLSAEKPETFMMLQRDAHILERALQDAGLSTDNGNLSFELAQDNGGFNDNNQNRSGGTGYAGEASDDDEQTILIETKMDWSIDPRTGRMRYDVLV